MPTGLCDSHWLLELHVSVSKFLASIPHSSGSLQQVLWNTLNKMLERRNKSRISCKMMYSSTPLPVCCSSHACRQPASPLPRSGSGNFGAANQALAPLFARYTLRESSGSTKFPTDENSSKQQAKHSLKGSIGLQLDIGLKAKAANSAEEC